MEFTAQFFEDRSTRTIGAVRVVGETTAEGWEAAIAQSPSFPNAVGIRLFGRSHNFVDVYLRGRLPLRTWVIKARPEAGRFKRMNTARAAGGRCSGEVSAEAARALNRGSWLGIDEMDSG